MEKCRFQISFSGDSKELLKKVEQGIKEAGGAISGDTTSGSISIKIPLLGKINGTYSVNNQTVSIIITKKPWTVRCSKIKKRLGNLDGVPDRQD